MIFVDSNVLIDVFAMDPKWAEWSKSALADACGHDKIALNSIIVAEVASSFETLDQCLAWLIPFDPEYLELTNLAAFQGGKAFQSHRLRRRAGQETTKSVLPDFLIGGHAQTLGATILTRDPRFYRAYFPNVPLITPSKDDQ